MIIDFEIRFNESVLEVRKLTRLYENEREKWVWGEWETVKEIDK